MISAFPYFLCYGTGFSYVLCCSVYAFQTDSLRAFYCKVCYGELQIDHKAFFLLTSLRFRLGQGAGDAVGGGIYKNTELCKFLHLGNEKVRNDSLR